jgi:hypothetical protein
MIIALARKCDSAGAIIIISLLLGRFPLVTLTCVAWSSAEELRSARWPTPNYWRRPSPSAGSD